MEIIKILFYICTPPVYYYSPKKRGTPEIWRKTCDLKNDFVFLHPNITDGKFFGKSKKACMSCGHKQRGISKRAAFQLAKNYAIKNQVAVVFYKCSDWNFCEAGAFDPKIYTEICRIDKNGKIYVKS